MSFAFQFHRPGFIFVLKDISGGNDRRFWQILVFLRAFFYNSLEKFIVRSQKDKFIARSQEDKFIVRSQKNYFIVRNLKDSH